MKAIALQRVVWNSNKYFSPSGTFADSSGFPSEYGYGHEEWNNNPKRTWRGCRVFHAQSKSQKLLAFASQSNLCSVLWAYDDDKSTRIVGIACGVRFNEPKDQKRISEHLGLYDNKNDVWSIPSVHDRLGYDEFEKIWDENYSIIHWRAPEELFYWFDDPIHFDAVDLVGGNGVLSARYKNPAYVSPKPILALMQRKMPVDHGVIDWLRHGEFHKELAPVGKRNPPWSRDELVITLDFYIRHTPHIPGKTSAEISELSAFLTRLQIKLGGELPNKFRNVNGVYMKLMNFSRFDTSYDGVGLQRGNKDEEVVWDLYVNAPKELRKIADGIRDLVSNNTPLPLSEVIGDNEEGEEGRLLSRTHRYRERDPRLAKKKKEKALQNTGKLTCEVCGFDFAALYGERGYGFIECHHTKPISELGEEQKTKLSELALVCSNCHRIMHRKRPWMTVEELRKEIAEGKKL